MRRKSLRLGCLKWFARFYERRRASGVRRLSAGISCLESLEERTLLASVSDSGGDTLTIDLATIDESLTIASDGTSYTFTSTQNFTNADVQNLGDFSSFGATTLTLSNLERYASIRITDSQSGTSVRFVDNSMVGIFHQDFEILLDDGNQQAWMTV
ncbi:MAG: hypothetical protein KDA80_03170, partial [Planctomycetaceae bacterium]|nr:hypothetical protein [Planctomycetaceae bacterium]